VATDAMPWTLANHRPPPTVRGWSQTGFCDFTATGDGVQCRASEEQGTWTVHSLRECWEACLSCSRCRFISHNPGDGDCSWFRRCSRLQHAGTQHVTYRVRHRNGSIAALEGKREGPATRKRHQVAASACRQLVNARARAPSSPPAMRAAVMAQPPAAADTSERRLRVGLATLFTSNAALADTSECRAEHGYGCAVLPWCASAQRLRSTLSNAGLLISVELLAIGNGGRQSGCRFSSFDDRDCPGLRFVQPSSALREAASAHVQRVIDGGVMSYDQQHMQAGQVFLYKWELLRLGRELDAVLYSDLDVDLYPELLPPQPQRLPSHVALEWSVRLPKLVDARHRGRREPGRGVGGVGGGGTAPADVGGAVMVGYADATTPLNGGLFWILPPQGDDLYREGIEVLRAPWNATHGWERAGGPAALLTRGGATTAPVGHVHITKLASWTQVDFGDLDQGLLLYMLYLKNRRGAFMSRHGQHTARHFVRGIDGKPNQRTLAYGSRSFGGVRGCSWDNLKRYAYLSAALPELVEAGSSASSSAPMSPCARRYRRVAGHLKRHLNASACCDALGAAGPRGHFGNDMVPVF
jgi:hypothetical protein